MEGTEPAALADPASWLVEQADNPDVVEVTLSDASAHILLLPAEVLPDEGKLVAYDGDEGFIMESVEALYYEVVAATPAEILALERARYRLLRRAFDFELVAE